MAIALTGHGRHDPFNDDINSHEQRFGGFGMTESKNNKTNTSTNRSAAHIKDPGKIERSDVRHDRLKQALRENLKRRKSQIKGRADVADAPVDDEA